MTVELSAILQATIAATRAAGLAIMGFYRESFSVIEKSPDNPVTEADFASDRLLKERLSAILPRSGWLSEETVDNPLRLEREWTWVVDPLDGTKEFVMGIPEFSISVALVKDATPELGVVFNPPTGELYYARRGGGVYFGHQRVSVSTRADLAGARVDASRTERARGEFEPFEHLVQLRTVGSIAYKLARVAAGQSDATWSRGPKNQWDICAGMMLVEEAGGRCVDLDDVPFRFNEASVKVNGIIADNGRLHRQLLALLAPHRHSARLD